MKDRASGILIENGKLLLIHRIKNNDEYYVIPGGGIEEGEDIYEATKRELYEEVGINICLLNNKPLIILKEKERIQYFMLIKRASGIIGTGNGPEYTNNNYKFNGTYMPEMVNIIDIVDGKINMVPVVVKNELINIIKSLNKNVAFLNSNDFLGFIK